MLLLTKASTGRIGNRITSLKKGAKPLTLDNMPALGVKYQVPIITVGCIPMITITGHTDI